MYITLQHLRSISAIHHSGGLVHAANMLNTTQSALSHQIAKLEEQVGTALFVRRSKPLRLSDAGMRLLRCAEQVLPEITQIEAELAAFNNGKVGRLHIALQCHACFDWLFPVIALFRKSWPDIEIDIRAGLAFETLPALMREDVDLVITSTIEAQEGAHFSPLFDYHPTFVASAQNPLAAKSMICAEDLADQALITYPVPREKLDVFTELLHPAGIEPQSQRQVELTAVILMLVGANRGVAVLPDWVLRDLRINEGYITRPLGPKTITKRMYAAIRQEDQTLPYLAHFQKLIRTEAVKLQRSAPFRSPI